MDKNVERMLFVKNVIHNNHQRLRRTGVCSMIGGTIIFSTTLEVATFWRVRKLYSRDTFQNEEQSKKKKARI
jgi:hypothetical protein